MRAGAGYVTALVPASLNLVFEQRLLEVMSVPLPDEDGALTPAGLDVVLERAARAGALVLGPGLGRAEGTFELARELARRVEIALLLDADGLNAHAGRLESLAGRPAPTIMTPHAGELARLLDCPVSEVAAHRLRSVRRASEQARAIVVLKGDDTIVATPDGRAAVSRGGAPALATAGTGDVLSGVIGAYLSKRMDPFHAACAGVFVHARAGQLAERSIGHRGCDRAGRDRAAAARPGRERLTVALRALARVNLAAIERNVVRLRSRLVNGAELCAVVKADASGHGAVPVAKAALAGGATGLAVATADEAAELRAAGIDAPMLVLGAISADELPVALAAGAELVAWSERFVDALAARAAGPETVGVHVKLDSGMGRLGTRETCRGARRRPTGRRRGPRTGAGGRDDASGDR